MITQPQFTPESLKQLQSISEHSDETFRDFSKSLDTLFYESVLKSLHKDENLAVTSGDVFHFMQIKEILEILHITFNQTKQ